MSDETIHLCAIVRATPEALTELLQLPPGAYIDAVYSPHDAPGNLELRIRGAGWPTKLGETIQQTTATVFVHFGEDGSILRRVIDWGLPK